MTDAFFLGTALSRQNRYERMLSQGHKSALLPKKIPKENRSVELRKQILELLRNGRKLSQSETRKLFSQYLSFVLKRIPSGTDQQDHIDIVLKFLQKASNYLRSPFSVKVFYIIYLKTYLQFLFCRHLVKTWTVKIEQLSLLNN